jgi:RHS repeat-associated protein
MEARYFSSAQGRFTIPDWSAKEEPVPYAKLEDPQSLNLYGYVRNNPLSRFDVDGHCDSGGHPDLAGPCAPKTADPAGMRQNLGPNPANQSKEVTITYDKQAPPMQPKTAAYVEKVADAAGVGSINISATTNGQHAPNSNHYNGTAVDINKVDGKRVITAGKDPAVAADVSSIQKTANSPKVGVAHENYGPAGLYKDGKRMNNDKLQAQHENHIHITIPRSTNDNY